MFVKICGITNREDALAAVDAGARALGFNFYNRSPRAVTAQQVSTFVNDIPANVWKVGIFVNETPGNIEQVGRDACLDVAQLHGDETPADHPSGLRIWRAFRMTAPDSADPGYPAEAVLLDGPGSGRTFDWTWTRRFQKFILAGGLDETNVARAIAAAHPWGVDVSSGIEQAPGRKDHARMKKFIKEALAV